MDPFVLLVVQTAQRDVLRYAVVEHGVQSVMTSGTTLMLVLYVDSWDIVQVRKVYMLHCYCPKIGTAFRNAYFGQGTGTIVMDDVHCVGNESYLTNCTHITSHNCGHYEDAGVRCTRKYFIMIHYSLYSCVCNVLVVALLL